MIYDKGLRHILYQLGKLATLLHLELIISFPPHMPILKSMSLVLILQEDLSHQCAFKFKYHCAEHKCSLVQGLASNAGKVWSEHCLEKAWKFETDLWSFLLQEHWQALALKLGCQTSRSQMKWLIMKQRHSQSGPDLMTAQSIVFRMDKMIRFVTSDSSLLLSSSKLMWRGKKG